MWLAPALVGVAITGRGPQALFLGTALVLFLARYPLTLWARGTPLSVAQRGWLTTYLALGLALGLMLLTRYERWLLLPLAALALAWLAVHFVLARAHKERTVAGQWVGVAGLVLAGPAAYYVGSGSLDAKALSLGILSFLYFGYPIYYVKFRIDPLARKSYQLNLMSKLRLGRQPLLYQALSLALVAGLAGVGVAPWGAFVTFLPATAQVIIGVVRVSPQLSMKRLGFTQVGHSILFAALLTLAFKVG
ncbi:MAG: YwiC-like family protein [Chloroflexi bacterium]|nr:YwiC-like family protein [Chloroflexota bacterium]